MKGSFFRSVLINAVYLTLIMLSISKYNHATDFFVTSVIREIPMKSGETAFKDYYINAGSNNGLKKGLYIEAVRKMPAYDNINSKLIGDTGVKIARLQLIHVDKGISVARLVKFYEKEKTPLAGFDAVMIGDFIEVAERQ